MSEPIKIGDLVVVVKPMRCCGNDSNLGAIFRVRWIGQLNGECEWCGQEGPSEPGADYECDEDSGGFLVENLKRIPPLGELEGTKEDLSEPELQGIDYADI